MMSGAKGDVAFRRMGLHSGLRLDRQTIVEDDSIGLQDAPPVQCMEGIPR